MIISFQAKFAELVERGEKSCTIRFREKNIPKVGDRLSLWRTSRGKERWLIGVAECTKISSVRLVKPNVWINGVRSPTWKLAEKDGFKSIGDFWEFFGEEPRTGYLIEWNPKQIVGRELREELREKAGCEGNRLEDWYPCNSDIGLAFERSWCDGCKKNSSKSPCRALTMAFVEGKCHLWKMESDAAKVLCLGWLPKEEKCTKKKKKQQQQQQPDRVQLNLFTE
jgi:hypothetical protein